MVARANAHVRYPAAFQLVAAMNPCRCGHGGLRPRRLRQGPALPAPVPEPRLRPADGPHGPAGGDADAVTAADLALPFAAEGTVQAAERVARAPRGPGGNAAALNARLEGEGLETAAAMEPNGRALLAHAAEAQGLSARAFTRTRRLARTIADLERRPNGSQRVHIAESLDLIAGRCRGARPCRPSAPSSLEASPMSGRDPPGAMAAGRTRQALGFLHLQAGLPRGKRSRSPPRHGAGRPPPWRPSGVVGRLRLDLGVGGQAARELEHRAAHPGRLDARIGLHQFLDAAELGQQRQDGRRERGVGSAFFRQQRRRRHRERPRRLHQHGGGDAVGACARTSGSAGM